MPKESNANSFIFGGYRWRGVANKTGDGMVISALNAVEVVRRKNTVNNLHRMLWLGK